MDGWDVRCSPNQFLAIDRERNGVMAGDFNESAIVPWLLVACCLLAAGPPLSLAYASAQSPIPSFVFSIACSTFGGCLLVS